MFQQAGINTQNRNISIHSGKVTCATTLYNKGFDNKAVCGRSGHRSSAVELYKRPAEQMLSEISMALQLQNPEKENIRPNCVSHVKEEKPQQNDKKNEDSGRDVPSDENTLKINVPSGIKKIIIEKEGKCVTIEI